MIDNYTPLSKVQIEFISGLSAGTASTLVFHPLDLIKTRLQVYRSTSIVPVTTFAILRELIQKNSRIQGFYRGLTPNLLGNAGSWSIFFSFKSMIEGQLVKLHSRHAENMLSESNPSATYQSREKLAPIDYFLSSGISGIIITLSTNPIWVLKTRMLSLDKEKEGAYKNMWHGARQIYRSEGYLGFYKGVGLGLLGTTHGAVQFSVYEPLKNLWKQYNAQDRISFNTGLKEERLGVVATLTISGMAKIFSGIVTYPLQVIRSRLQISQSHQIYGNRITEVVGDLWREWGWKGFYKGLNINIIRVLPATWLTFLVYENVKYCLAMFS